MSPAGIGVAVVALFLAVLGYDDWQQRSARHACDVRAEALTLRVASLEAAAQVQEQAVQRLVAEANTARDDAARALDAARKVSQGQAAKIRALQARILVSPKSDCASAVGEVREMLR